MAAAVRALRKSLTGRFRSPRVARGFGRAFHEVFHTNGTLASPVRVKKRTAHFGKVSRFVGRLGAGCCVEGQYQLTLSMQRLVTVCDAAASVTTCHCSWLMFSRLSTWVPLVPQH